MINIFTLRDFNYQGGGMIRILGILKLIDYKSHGAKLYSNRTDTESILSGKAKGLEIHNFDLDFTSNDKRMFQLALAFLPISIVNILFRSKLNKLILFCKENNLSKQTLFCCEYLDLSLGYFMKMNGLITDYICDIHGLVPNEFSSKKEMRVYNFLRFIAAVLLDKKVFSTAKSVVYASTMMKSYMENRIPKLQSAKSLIIPYLISSEQNGSSICYSTLQNLKSKYSIGGDDVVFFFAGSFKSLGGVTDLLKAFKSLSEIRKSARLIIIGQGEEEKNVLDFIERNSLRDKVIRLESIPYSKLRTFQELSDIIICPDRMNLYSDMILHLKYIDSLSSGKIVINGSFNSVKEININQSLSINFIPSDVEDLYKKLLFCLDNRNELSLKYERNPEYVKEKLTYEAVSTDLRDLF